MSVSQSAAAVLMVSPASFGFDEQTAATNAFQVRPDISPDSVTSYAMAEFDQAVLQLNQAGVQVIVHQGDPSESKPDAVFPNNWISTWPDGRIYLYPMATASRRHERDKRVLDQLAEQFTISDIVDISDHESNQQYLESTGVIVFDHPAKLAYACLSQRCDEALFRQHVSRLGYQPVVFRGTDQTGLPIYHSNVMMGIQSTTAVICSQAIADPTERASVLDLLGRHHQIIDISFEQMGAFCGNILEVGNRYGSKVLVMSQSAYDAFDQSQLELLSADKTILPINIPIIEQAGGGSARCMLAEVFLARA